MTDQDPADAEARSEAIQRLKGVAKTNAETIRTLAGRGAALQPQAVQRHRLELMIDLMFGTFDPEDLDAVATPRLTFELAWAERLRLVLSQVLIDTAGSPEIEVPTQGLIVPTHNKRTQN